MSTATKQTDPSTSRLPCIFRHKAANQYVSKIGYKRVERNKIECRVEYDAAAVDKQIFNKDTNRQILKNLITHGIKSGDGQRLGKSIIFARSHNHAILMKSLFDEMYPQYAGKFCQVIDNYDPRAEDLIDDFKGIGSNPELTIAISVDMLDTGIDVPEIVNLVFAKPVFSYVKFWQMIGRGTRLCKNLFGPGQDKTEFQIFDHWKNFEFFDERYIPVEPKEAKSLLHRLFDSRIALSEVALSAANMPAFELAVKLIEQDINDLPEKSISVQEKWREVLIVKAPDTVRRFDPAIQATLRQTISPLMQWRDLGAGESAYLFDLLVSRLQTELLRRSAKFADFKDKLLELLDLLVHHLPQVRSKADTIAQLRTQSFWNEVSVEKLETVRTELRGIMRFQQSTTPPRIPPKVVDVKEDSSLIERREYQPRLEGLDLVA